MPSTCSQHSCACPQTCVAEARQEVIPLLHLSAIGQWLSKQDHQVNTAVIMQVLTVEQGVCTVRFNGPPPIGMGVQAAIKDKFPDIKTVELTQ